MNYTDMHKKCQGFEQADQFLKGRLGVDHALSKAQVDWLINQLLK